MAVLLEQCREKHISPEVGDWNRLTVKERRLFEARQIFDYKQYKNLTIHLGGTYQVENACIAIEAVEALKLENPMRTAIIQGLSRAKWPGRFQCRSREPLIFIDGAHNADGAAALRESVEAYFPEQRKILIMGVFADKDYRAILEEMHSVSKTLISFTPENIRGLDSAELKNAAQPYFEQVIDANTAGNALDIAKKQAKSGDVIIIFGSLSTISTFCDIL